MSLPELLNLTRLRIARETTTGSGEADAGGWISITVTDAAAKREIIKTAEKRSPRRTLLQREVTHAFWSLATSHEIGLEFFWWFIESITGDASGIDGADLEQDSTPPTYAIETRSENGQLQIYRGVVPTEVKILFEERRVTTMDITWAALRRENLVSEKAGATTDYETILTPNYSCAVEITEGDWNEDPSQDEAVAHGGQLFLMREARPTQFSANGYPKYHIPAPWVVMGEVFMPYNTTITDKAKEEGWEGSIALRIGDQQNRIRINNTTGFVQEEPLIGYDWRVFRLGFEAQGDDLGAVAKFERDNG